MCFRAKKMDGGGERIFTFSWWSSSSPEYLFPDLWSEISWDFWASTVFACNFSLQMMKIGSNFHGVLRHYQHILLAENLRQNDWCEQSMYISWTHTKCVSSAPPNKCKVGTTTTLLPPPTPCFETPFCKALLRYLFLLWGEQLSRKMRLQGQDTRWWWYHSLDTSINLTPQATTLWWPSLTFIQQMAINHDK